MLAKEIIQLIDELMPEPRCGIYENDKIQVHKTRWLGRVPFGYTYFYCVRKKQKMGIWFDFWNSVFIAHMTEADTRFCEPKFPYEIRKLVHVNTGDWESDFIEMMKKATAEPNK